MGPRDACCAAATIASRPNRRMTCVVWAPVCLALILALLPTTFGGAIPQKQQHFIANNNIAPPEADGGSSSEDDMNSYLPYAGAGAHASSRADRERVFSRQPLFDVDDAASNEARLDFIRYLRQRGLLAPLNAEDEAVISEAASQAAAEDAARRELERLWHLKKKSRTLFLQHRLGKEMMREAVRPYEAGKIKRGGSCLFHAGLAHNCDYRDVVGAVNEVSHWGSDLAPGKRRRRKRNV